MITLLVVDDDPLILKGLKRSLHKMKWEVKYALGGEEAIEIIKTFPADFIITDMKMPVINGAEVLRQVNEIRPSAVRIVLSGFADTELGIEACYYAHQWFNKPCELEELIEQIVAINTIRQSIAYDDVKAKLGTINHLPSEPKKYLKIRALLEKSSASARDITHIISEDVALSTKILQVANNAFLANRYSVDSLEDAIVRLGIDVVCNLVAAAEIYSPSQIKSSTHVQQILTQGLNTGRMASELVSAANKEKTMLAGLMHNIGELILAQIEPDNYARYLEQRSLGQDNNEKEIELFGISNANIIVYLLHLWHLPYSLIEQVILQNTPKEAFEKQDEIATAIYLAKVVAAGEMPPSDLVEKYKLEEKLALLQSLCTP